MKITSLLFASLLVFPLLLTAPSAYAGDCFEDPIYDHEWTAVVTTGAFVRDLACMEGSTVLTTLPVGTELNITGETDGWYRIQTSDGTEGWIGQWLLEVTNENAATVSVGESETEAAPVSVDGSLLDRTRGYVLLQVEDNGEAWYVHPVDDYRYYMKDGPTAYEMMRAFGLGITNSDLAKVQAGDNTLVNALRGRILLQVEDLGQAYYIHPATGEAIYMQDGAAAYEIMRFHSLGITNNDLSGIQSKEFSSVPYAVAPVKTVAGANQNIHISGEQGGVIPSNVDTVGLNEYWLDLVNGLRAASGDRQLVLDQRFIDTASDYSTYMYEAQAFTHERADGGSMHDWIDEQGLTFTVRDSEGGWVNNYFTENISWGYGDNTQQEMIDLLEDSMDLFLAEASYNGAHYRTLYHDDWNSVGLGFYFEKKDNDFYRVYIAFHYGSLEL